MRASAPTRLGKTHLFRCVEMFFLLYRIFAELSSSLVTLKYNKAALRAMHLPFRVMHLPYSTGGTRTLFFFCGESPLTLRPNFNCKKGNVTAAAAACMPRRGSFVGENL